MLKFKWVRLIVFIHIIALAAVVILTLILPPFCLPPILSRLTGLIAIAAVLVSYAIFRSRLACPECGNKRLLTKSLLAYSQGDAVYCSKCGKHIMLD